MSITNNTGEMLHGNTGSRTEASMSPELLDMVYRSVLLSVPYNSISQFYEYLAGEEPGTKFGASCGFQALEVGKRLAALGAVGVRYLMDGRHAAAVCEHAGDTYLFDPYLLHVSAINLSETLSDPVNGKEFDAYPLVASPHGTLPSKLRVRYLPERRTIALEYLKRNPMTGNLSLTRYFKLRTDKPLQGAPPADAIRAILFHPEQNNLSIRVLCPETGSLSDLVYPICYYHGDPEILASRLIIRAGDGSIVAHDDRARFDAEVARMASIVGATPEQLVQFVLRGVEIYERFAPANIDYQPYTGYRPPAGARDLERAS